VPTMSEQETKRSEVIFLLKNVSKCAENVAKVVKVSKRAIFRMKKKLKENKGPERVVGSEQKPILNGTAGSRNVRLPSPSTFKP